MRKEELPPVLICCGGGTDSTALIDYYLSRNFRVQGIHFDYGQIACPGERLSIAKISKHYQIPISLLEMRPKISASTNGEFGSRNAMFILACIEMLKTGPHLISLGVHSGTPYYDCSNAFAFHMQQLLDGYLGGQLILDTPFLQFTKRDIYSYCKAHNVPVSMTYSCQQEPNVPCGMCRSCLDRNLYDLNS